MWGVWTRGGLTQGGGGSSSLHFSCSNACLTATHWTHATPFCYSEIVLPASCAHTDLLTTEVGRSHAHPHASAQAPRDCLPKSRSQKNTVLAVTANPSTALHCRATPPIQCRPPRLDKAQANTPPQRTRALHPGNCRGSGLRNGSGTAGAPDTPLDPLQLRTSGPKPPPPHFHRLFEQTGESH